MSIADKLSRLSDARDAIITALSGKGVSASGHGFEDFATDIASIASTSVTVTDTLDSHGGTIREITTSGSGVTTLQSVSKSYTPTESAQSETISPGTGYDALSQVSVSVSAIPSDYVGSGVTSRSSSDLTASGATVTAPAGYYGSAATKSVASGTAGTPTASKGTVSNHSVTVTPSVTNTAGYISGGTKTGTGVTVSASELVSGSETKTSNGTYDVTNLASLVVNVSGGTVSVDTKTTTLSATSQNISFSSLKGTPKYWFLRSTTQMSSGSTTYYYIVDIRYNGTNTTGNSFRMGSTRRIYNITSGLYYSYSGSTLTVTAGSSSSSQPGQFYAGEYELVYIY